MRYKLTIRYTTPITEQVTGWLRRILQDWDDEDKQLLVSQTHIVEVKRPFSAKEIRALVRALTKTGLVREATLEPIDV